MITRLLLAGAALIGVTAFTTYVLVNPGPDGYVVQAQRVTAADIYAWASAANVITVVVGLLVGSLVTWPIAKGLGYTEAERDLAVERADMAEKPEGAWWVPEPRTRRRLSRLTFWAQMRVVAARMRRTAPGAPEYVANDGLPVRTDPTFGRIDPDIQQAVEAMKPASTGSRVALENTLQARRDRGGDPR